jgi:hypothetical protein
LNGRPPPADPEFARWNDCPPPAGPEFVPLNAWPCLVVSGRPGYPLAQIPGEPACLPRWMMAQPVAGPSFRHVIDSPPDHALAHARHVMYLGGCRTLSARRATRTSRGAFNMLVPSLPYTGGMHCIAYACNGHARVHVVHTRCMHNTWCTCPNSCTAGHPSHVSTTCYAYRACYP